MARKRSRISLTPRRPWDRRHARPRAPAGTPPGTLIATPGAAAPVIDVVTYDSDRMIERRIDRAEELRELRDGWPITWVNVEGLGDAAVVQEIGDIFGLHPLALEDVLSFPQRAKVDEYADHFFLIIHMALLAETGTDGEQVGLFLGSDFVVTFQERPGDCLDPVRERLRTNRGRIRGLGADYLAYSIVDAVIDNYFPVLDTFSERLERTEDNVLSDPDEDDVRAIHAIRRDLMSLRHAVWPLREAVNTLIREPSPLVSDETRTYLRDCYDHTIEVLDFLENYREIASGLLDVYLSSISNRMNEIMKVLTIIATIFIPLTFIAGVYGTNFNTEVSPWNLPELNWYWGYPSMLGLMLVVAGALVIYFQRKGWL